MTLFKQLIDVKEWSRQISELPQDDFALLHMATLSSVPTTPGVSMATGEPVDHQLSALLDRLRMMESVTSDSGAVSDYSESTDCKSHSSTSLTLTVEDRATLHSLSSDLEDKDNSTASQLGEACRAAEDHSQQEQTEVIHSQLEEYKVHQPSVCDSLCHVKATGSDEGQSLGQLPERDWVAKTESVNAQPLKIRRKTKRHYGLNWRRNYSYHDNSRSRRDQCSTLPLRDLSRSKPLSGSSFNHEEAARFLWKGRFWLAELKTFLILIIPFFRMEISGKGALFVIM